MSGVRVLLVDDHELVRAGLCALLSSMPGIRVVGQAGDGMTAISLARELRPDVVIMDMMMPGFSGIAATARLLKEAPGTRVLVLSMNAVEELVMPAMAAGATGYLLKTVEPAELERAIHAVAEGKVYVTAALAGLVAARAKGLPSRKGPLERLTPRQREVLQLVAEGQSTRAIATRLGVSARTVETYRAQIMDSLAIRDIAGLTRFAIRMGLVNPHD